jgi:hypothetical protein
MFHLLPKKMFVFSTTLKLFGAETCITEIRQASKICPEVFSEKNVCKMFALEGLPQVSGVGCQNCFK